VNGVLRHRRNMTTPMAASQDLMVTITHLCTGAADQNMDFDYIWFSQTR